MKQAETARYFELLNEIGIIAQLARAAFEARLPDGMILPHFSVLNHLIRVRDGSTPLALARAFQVPKTSMTHTLSGLEERGFIELRPNPKDGRSKCVWLTEAGRTFRETAIRSLSPELADLVRDKPAGEIGPVLDALRSLRIYLDESRNED